MTTGLSQHDGAGASPPASGLATVLHVLADAVVVIDAGGRLLWGNLAAERLFGMRMEDAIGLPSLELVHPDDLELAVLSLSSVQGKEFGSPIEVRVRVDDGWRLVEIIGTAVAFDGEPAVALSLRDLTQRRRWEVAADEDAAFRSLIQNAATITMLVDAAGRLRSASAALTRLLGHDREQVDFSPLVDLVVGDDRLLLETALARARDHRANGPVPAEARFVRRSGGEPVPLALTIVNLLDDPTVEGFVISAHDISDRRRAEEEMRHALSVLNATFDSTADGILVVDLDGRIVNYNRRLVDMWQIPEDVLHDDQAALELAAKQLRDPEQFLSRVQELYSRPAAESHDTIEFADGRVFERYSRPQCIDDVVVGRVWSFHDVTERKRLEDDLSHQAFHDTLTGLANQALFSDRLMHAVARSARSASTIAVMFMDLDDFKTVNDSLGHAAGDQLLVEVGARLEACLRASDTAARLGGDEFAVLLENLSSTDEASSVARRILDAVRLPVLLHGKELLPSVSIGIAFGDGASDPPRLLRNADLAMYTAKGRGRGQHAVFEESMHVTAMERLELQADLRRALANDELSVAYQPIVDLGSARILGVEALARWKHPRRGFIPPDVFIPLAEDTGIIGELGDFVLRTAIGQLEHWCQATGVERSICLSVNLSPSQLVSGALVPRVEELVRGHHLRPGQLILEITEGAMMMDGVAAEATAVELKKLGVQLAVDDFGTGYSSLTHLQRFPIDIVKIDRSFVQAVDRGPEESSLAKAIVRLAQTLDLTVVAEGVETAGQAEELAALGCALAQGYLLARPTDSAGITRMLTGADAITSPLAGG